MKMFCLHNLAWVWVSCLLVFIGSVIYPDGFVWALGSVI